MRAQLDWDAIFRRIVRNSELMPNGCWRWTGRLHQGYAYMSMRTGKPHPSQVRVARLAWGCRMRKKMPRHLQAEHTCNFKGCVNPDCIDARSNATNQRLKIARMTEGDKARLRQIWCANLGVRA